ncbi:MAG TPA: hypothetical protein VK459_06840 [Polyangiaceae bacterium]|nr:hypothetical protein [Polyangiaceae bacterium]
MSFLKSWFADPPPTPEPALEPAPAPESVPVELPWLLEAMREALAELEPATLDPDVVRAKIADICRGLAIEPMEPLELERLASNLDRAGWDRMGLLVLVMERGALGDKLAPLLKGRIRTAVRRGLIETAESSPLITLELLERAPLRLEELARRFVMGLGASIAGEMLEASRAALARLDYNRLMTEAERAKRAAMDPTGKGS